MKVSPEGINITKRFFEAIQVLREQKKIRGLQTFTRTYGINYWNINTVKKNQEHSVLKAEWLAYLVRDFNLSAEWLLLGTGNMFTEKPARQVTHRPD